MAARDTPPGASRTPSPATPSRETFASRFGALMTLLGVAIGLGNVWRFPYMVGKFGGAAFVLVYVVVAVVIGVPGLMAEWALGRQTRRGPVGAFAVGGFPLGKQVGWFFFFVVGAATAYYTAVIGWVLWYAIGAAAHVANISLDSAAILPPDAGVSAKSFVLQLACTGTVIAVCAIVVQKGLRSGIEIVSKILMPVLCALLLVLVVRALTLPGAMEGVRWYILKFRMQDLNAKVVVAAIGHAIFSLSLGGTFMVVYGSYLGSRENLRNAAVLTVAGDTISALIAGLAIIPAVFALGLEPTSGPTLLFSTLPKVFASIPAGWLFGFLFFAGLFGAGYLSDIGAFEALTAGLTDNTGIPRTRAVWLVSAMVFLLAIPPSINTRIFVPWDLTFGSGMQTLGSLVAVLTLGWCVNRAAALEELASRGEQAVPRWLWLWIKFGIPAALITVGVWWLLTSVLGTVSDV